MSQCPDQITDSIRLAAHIAEAMAFLFTALLSLHARKQGWRWVATLLVGALFGWAVEAAFIHLPHQQGAVWYYYCNELFVAAPYDVPLSVALGWGSILYVSTWTSQRVQLPDFLRPFAAALLAIDIDLSLDPLATKFGFWTWHRFVDGTDTLLKLDGNDSALYYGVPYDNFLGWFLIVASYALTTRTLFNWVDTRKHRDNPRFSQQRRAGTLAWGVRQGRYGHASDWADFVVPPLAAAISLLAIVQLKQFVSPRLYGKIPDTMLFVGSLPVALLLVVAFARNSTRTSPPSRTVLALPAAYHGMAWAFLALVTFRDHMPFSTLLVAIPFQGGIGVIAFAWSSLDLLLPPSKGRQRAQPRPGAPPNIALPRA
jgi:hypothetical protein